MPERLVDIAVTELDRKSIGGFCSVEAMLDKRKVVQIRSCTPLAHWHDTGRVSVGIATAGTYDKPDKFVFKSATHESGILFDRDIWSGIHANFLRPGSFELVLVCKIVSRYASKPDFQVLIGEESGSNWADHLA